MTALAIAPAALRAYVEKDRAAIEALVADDFRFTSPLDNALDRATYLDRCWPNSAVMDAATVIEGAALGDRALILYEVTTPTKRFRNCELHTVRGGQLVSVEVYFGWDVPHPAPPGGSIDSDASSAA